MLILLNFCHQKKKDNVEEKAYKSDKKRKERKKRKKTKPKDTNRSAMPPTTKRSFFTPPARAGEAVSKDRRVASKDRRSDKELYLIANAVRADDVTDVTRSDSRVHRRAAPAGFLVRREGKARARTNRARSARC